MPDTPKCRSDGEIIQVVEEIARQKGVKSLHEEVVAESLLALVEWSVHHSEDAIPLSVIRKTVTTVAYRLLKRAQRYHHKHVSLADGRDFYSPIPPTEPAALRNLSMEGYMKRVRKGLTPPPDLGTWLDFITWEEDHH